MRIPTSLGLSSVSWLLPLSRLELESLATLSAVSTLSTLSTLSPVSGSSR